MSASAVARQYAAALHDVARRSGQVDRAGRELADFAALVASHDELGRLFRGTGVPAPQKRAVVEALLSRMPDVSHAVSRLLLLLAERGRLVLIDDIVAAFRERTMEAGRVAQAELTTAAPLDEATSRAIVAALGRAVGSELTVTARVDPAVIGGVVAKVGSVVFDGSVARHLERLRERLLSRMA
jgi:F-type H+-transporting ATPase subunit delta